MSNIAVKSTFSLTPSNLNEAMQYADIMAKSTIIPKHYQGKPGDILVAVQMGAELGLKPIQALQNIAVINSKPAVYGDALLALVQANSAFEDIRESFDEKLQAAICTVKRRNQSDYTVIYSVEDAKKAGLWAKQGPWTQYPKRMLQMRARGFALRDKFADILGGLITAEEAQDYPVDITPKTQTVSQKLDNLLEKIEPNNHVVQDMIFISTDNIEISNDNEDDLANKNHLYKLINDYNVSDEVIAKWCEKAGVSTLEELDADKIKACIEHLETKHINA